MNESDWWWSYCLREIQILSKPVRRKCNWTSERDSDQVETKKKLWKEKESYNIINYTFSTSLVAIITHEVETFTSYYNFTQ